MLVATAEGQPYLCELADQSWDPNHPTGSEAVRYAATLRDTCDQLRAGIEPDRPDLVACYGDTDHGTLAGTYPRETCDRLATLDGPVDDLEQHARSNGHS